MNNNHQETLKCLQNIQAQIDQLQAPLKSVSESYSNYAKRMRGIISSPSMMAVQQMSTQTNSILSESINPLMRKYYNSFSDLSVAQNIQESFNYSPEQTTRKIQEIINKSLSVSDSYSKVLKNFETLSKNISFVDNDIIIPDDTLSGITDLVDLPDECISKNDSENHSTQMSLKDFFLYIIFPILLMVIPMMQTHYWEVRNSLEAEVENMKIEEYEERLLQIEEEKLKTDKQILSYLKQLTDSLNMNQEFQPSLDEIEDSDPHVQPKNPSSDESDHSDALNADKRDTAENTE